ncbi:MAG TPA: fibronectin type III domain-containing protein, partial [Cytophagales bacterium]
YLDACLAQRLPARTGQPLRPLDPGKAWLGDTLQGTVVPAAGVAGDPRHLGYLPDEATARRWQEFIRTGTVTDTTPPPAPRGVRATVPGTGTVRLHWQATADLESGIKAFRIYQDGKPVGQLGGPTDSYAKGSFQYANYGDDPVPEPLYFHNASWRPTPLAFLLYGLVPGRKYTCQVTTVNHAGLESPKSKPVTLRLPAP